jgi:hypothetical protein
VLELAAVSLEDGMRVICGSVTQDRAGAVEVDQIDMVCAKGSGEGEAQTELVEPSVGGVAEVPIGGHGSGLSRAGPVK